MQPFYGLTKLLNPKIAGALVIVVILLIAVPLTTLITQERVSTTPQANNPDEKSDTTGASGASVSLVPYYFDCKKGDPNNGVNPEKDCNQISPAKVFAIDLKIDSPTDAITSINIQIAFPNELISAEKVVVKNEEKITKTIPSTKPLIAEDFFVTKWTGTDINNNLGSIKLIGTIPNPGFITNSKTTPIIARLYFKAKKSGTATIEINTQNSLLSRSGDNKNILKAPNNYKVIIK